jgi:hypothetical protein
VARGWRKLGSCVNFIPNLIWRVRMRWVGHVVLTGDDKFEESFVGRPEEKGPLEGLRQY